MNNQGSIKKRLTVIIMAVTLITSITGYSIFIYWYMNNQLNKTVELSQTVGHILGQDVAKLILLNDVSAAADITSNLKSFSTLESMVLYKLDQKAIFQYSKKGENFKVKLPSNISSNDYIMDGNLLKMYIKAKFQDTHLGYIELNFHIDTIFDVIKKDINLLLSIMLFMFIVSYLLALFFAKKFTNPILNLVRFLEKIDLLDSIDNRIKTDEKNEFGKLYDEVNTMLQRIEASSKAQKIAAVAFETQSGMTITDKNQKILQVNKAFTKITGYSKEEVIGKTPGILKSGLHDQSFYDNMYKALKKNHIWIGEIKNKRKNGEILNEHLIIQSVLDNDGEDLYYIASFLDITKEKLNEAKLTEKEKLLIQQSKMAQMGEMLENIAHQWRQPLSLITTSASGLKVQKEYGILTDDILNGSLGDIEQAAVHLSNTIDDFRNFYKDDKEKLNFSIDDAIESSLKLLYSRFKNQNITILKDIDDIKISGFENELIQVFLNIFNNAKDELVKKTDQQKVISVFSTQDEKSVTISFQDNAGGIREDVIKHIFDSHFTTKEDTDGTGIGLFMSKLIVEKMGGKIEVLNEKFYYEDIEYLGARFNLILPK